PASGDISGKQAITEPLKHPDFFKVRQLVSVKDLYNNRVHFGHKDGSRNEHMQPYLFGNRLGTDIFDLDITIDHLHRALNFVAHIAYLKGIILFIMKSQQFGHAVETTAMTCGEYAHTRDWHPGLLLNMSEQGGQIRLPDICIFLSLQDAVNQQHLAVAECGKLKIATVGICDSNVNPTMITYPVPGNDDTSESIDLYLRLSRRPTDYTLEEPQQLVLLHKVYTPSPVKVIGPNLSPTPGLTQSN
uniref:Small ribosomal subunit protein uS2m n=1 Tax=Ciona savignyi TaxID=51511 RepID=H2YJT2_CIOSA